MWNSILLEVIKLLGSSLKTTIVSSVLFSPFLEIKKKKKNRLIVGQANLDLSDVANLG